MEIRPDDFSNRFSDMKRFCEPSLSPEEIGNCIGMVLFKPDATKSLLDLPIMEYIERELEESTGQTVGLFAFCLKKVKPGEVRKLYPEERNEQYLKYIQDHFSGGDVYVVLVAARNAPESLNRIKGSIRTGSGIRGNFCQNAPIGEESMDDWKAGKLDPDTTRRIGIELFAANLVHVPDDREGTIRAIELLYPPKEIDKMRASIPIFAKWLEYEQ
ncbi:MAG: hypothetical protein WC841_03635 [Candidatus Shapirobacteria bacterium]|jgi:hypothetical protein